VADFWFAECLPCKWQVTYDTEDEAISAAEEHVSANHAKVPAREKVEQRMGHVQLRGENTVGAAVKSFADPAAEATPASAGSEPAPAGPLADDQ
jgi:hypothetical protein